MSTAPASASVPEVESVVGKLGRAESALDPAPIGMMESIVILKPASDWLRLPVKRWFSDWPRLRRDATDGDPERGRHGGQPLRHHLHRALPVLRRRRVELDADASTRRERNRDMRIVVDIAERLNIGQCLAQPVSRRLANSP